MRPATSERRPQAGARTPLSTIAGRRGKLWLGAICCAPPLTAQNKFFVANASAVNWPCGGNNLSMAQAAGEEVGSVTAPIPADDELARMATALLREGGWKL